MTSNEKFHQLHYHQTPFLLANAWSAKSAELIAIGTSSGAIASSFGYEDGGKSLGYISANVKPQ